MIPVGTWVLIFAPDLFHHNKIGKVTSHSNLKDVSKVIYSVDIESFKDYPFFSKDLIILTQAQIYLYGD